MDVKTAEFMTNYALRFVGRAYRWGGDDPMSGFDCSGFVLEVLTAAGLWRPGVDTTALGIYTELTRRGGTRGPQAGAVCFFGKALSEIIHVGLCINSDLMVEAGGGGSKTLTEVDAEKQNAFIRVRPVRSRSDYLVSVTP